MNKYLDYIVEKVINNLGCSREDVYEMSPYEVLGSVLNWEGMIGWQSQIKSWIEDIYNVDLDKASRW